MAICKLCLTEKLLINKSHIIPNFMYRDLYDEHHKLRFISTCNIVGNNLQIKKHSSGIYEGGLLCSDCDSKLLGHKYEDYASKLIYGTVLPINIVPVCENHKGSEGLKVTICKNINYKLFKLFLLSLLWRSGISTSPFFKRVQLGSHQEELRKMILYGDPGDVIDYPIIIASYLTSQTVPQDLISSPRRIKTKEGFNIYKFVIGGLIYFFYVNSANHKPPKIILDSTINKKNEMTIIHIPENKALDIILRSI